MPRYNKLLISAIIDAFERQKAISEDQSRLKMEIVVSLDEKTKEESLDKIFDNVKLELEHDIEAFEANALIISEYRARMPFQLKFSKFTEVFTGAKALIDKEKAVFLSLATPYDISLDLRNMSINSNFYWGTSDPSFYSAAILSSGLTLSSFGHSNFKPLNNAQYIDKPVDMPLTGRFISENSILCPHSGYMFGGSRDVSTKYVAEEKPNLAQDCSSWVEVLTGSPHTMTTLDLLFLNRHLQDSGMHPDWAARAGSLMSMLEPVDIESDLQAGDIFWWRSFMEGEDKATSNGAAGHVGFALDRASASDVTILSCARDMPRIEGICVKNFLLSDPQKLYGAFRLKSGFQDGISVSEKYAMFAGDDERGYEDLILAIKEKIEAEPAGAAGAIDFDAVD